MGKQIWWVLRTYLANKLFLAMLAGVSLWGFVFVANLLTSKSYQSNYPDAPRGKSVVNTPDSLDYVRSKKMEDQVDYLQLGGIWRPEKHAQQSTVAMEATAPNQVVAPPESFYDVLDEFPNLRIVHADMFNVDSRPALQRLAGRQGIEFLSISGTEPLDMAAVAKLPGLKRLELSAHKPVRDIDKLASLAYLETLVFTSEAGVDDAVLRDIAQLPHLKTLVIRWNYFNKGITDAGIKQLENSPSLKTFYVGGQPVPPQANLIVRGRALLSTIDVQPAVVVRRLPWVASFFPAGLAAGIGLIIANQFSSSASRLAPGFLSAHAVAAVGWLGAIVLLMTLSMVVSWQPFVQSLVLCTAAAMFFLVAGIDSVNRRRLGSAARTTLWDWTVSLGIPLLILATMFPGTLDLAQQWRFALVVAVGVFTAAAVWRAVAILQGLPGIQTADKPLQPSSSPNFISMNRDSLLARRERVVESLSEVPGRWPLWKSLRRWRAGNAPIPIVPFVAMFFVSAGAVWIAMRRTRPDGGGDVQAILLFFPLISLLMIAGQIAQTWRKRATCLNVESLRPVPRSVVQREWAIAMLLDLVTPAVLAGLGLGVASQLSINNLGSTEWRLALPSVQNFLAASVILTATLWVITAAVCSLQVVIERQWVRLVVMVPLILLNAAGLGVLLAYRRGTPARSLTTWDVLPLLWVPVLLSVFVLACTWRMWTRMEFDRRS